MQGVERRHLLRITELLAFDIPAWASPDANPCLVMPCPFCHRFHSFKPGSRYIRLRCSKGHADLYYLVWAGEAPAGLLATFVSGESLTRDPELLAVAQPRSLWGDVHDIPDEIASRIDVSEA